MRNSVPDAWNVRIWMPPSGAVESVAMALTSICTRRISRKTLAYAKPIEHSGTDSTTRHTGAYCGARYHPMSQPTPLLRSTKDVPELPAIAGYTAARNVAQVATATNLTTNKRGGVRFSTITEYLRYVSPEQIHIVESPAVTSMTPATWQNNGV
ncbi:hypothetical protein HDU83_000027 [Entophlyctis luteolus]|nr:hypothetical protein HDU83_000027 [Entophlyctis luteolus]